MGDAHAAYAAILSASAPFAQQLALGGLAWPLVFALFALPSLSVFLSLGTLSGKGPVLTYQRLSPIGAGIGWALTWHICERLYIQTLRSSQTFLYILFSIRSRLDWALECDHSYNSRLCNPFIDVNATHEKYHHYPDNFWPAQEFNRYLIRGNPIDNLSKVWEPNEWYLGRSSDHFYPAIPSLPLTFAHIIIWITVYSIVHKFSKYTDIILCRVCVILPSILYLIVIFGMFISGFSFGKTTEEIVPNEDIERVPTDFWADIKGFYRTSLVMVDYSTAFTGICLFAISRMRPGSSQLHAYVLVPLMMVVPAFLSTITKGCESHVATLQPAYKTYLSTDEVITFDLIPTCLATSSGGPIWAFFYFLAHFLYTCLGPLIVYTLFIYHAIVEQFPLIQNYSSSFYSAFLVFITALSTILYMPMGTKVITFFRYVSQSTTVHLIIYVLVFFVYGWQNLETDMLTATAEPSGGPLWKYLLGATSPIWTALMFTFVPTLLCSKATSVYDLLLGGNDLVKHIEAGTQFIEAPAIIRRLFGYFIMLAPLLIVLAFAIHALFRTIYTHKMPLRAAFQPSNEWLSHETMAQHRPKSHSLVYVVFNSMRGPSYRTILLVVMILELFFFLLLGTLLLINSFFGVIGSPNGSASNFRSIVLMILLTAHAMALIEMRWIYNKWDQASRLTLYIAVATMELAFLNGYMWMFAFNHDRGADLLQQGGPILLMIMNSLLRGACICAVIAVRAHIREASRPSRTRDATEIYEPDMGIPEVDMDDDTPIIFDLAR